MKVTIKIILEYGVKLYTHRKFSFKIAMNLFYCILFMCMIENK